MRARTLAALGILLVPLLASAVATLPARAQDTPPVVTAPATVSKPEGCVVDFVVTATAVPGATIVALTASSLPPGATFTVDPSNTSGVFHWATGSGSGGSYDVTFTAIDSQSLSSIAHTFITITLSARGPVVTAPASQSVMEGSCLTFIVTAVDPDGDPINCFTPGPVVPFGATFIANSSRTSATFTWCPPLGSVGSYTVTFVASSDICGGTACTISGSATTVIIVTVAEDHPPVVTAPATVSGSEATLITFPVTASDPDGEAILSFTAAGTAITAGGTFTTNATKTSGTFAWTPTFTQTGSYSVTFMASNSLSGTATTSISVGKPDRAPVVLAPLTQTADPNVLLTFTVSAADPDGQAITSFTMSPTIPGATFATNVAYTSGTFNWTPTLSQSGTYDVSFTASNSLSGSARTTITVNNACPFPTADAGGPYSGVLNAPIEFDGSGSSDPSGASLTYAWDFGDGTMGVGVTVSHIYTSPGTYSVSLTVQNACGSSTDQTTATTTDLCASVFAMGGNKTLRLDAGKPTWCVQIEPINNCYSNAEVVLSNIVMRFSGGSVTEIRAIDSKSAVTGDKNNNGIEEITACFDKSDLRMLFSGLPSGENTATVTLVLALNTGGHAVGQLSVRVFSSGPALAAAVNPNPFNPRAKLSFRTTREGFVRARLFDSSGRLVRTLLDERSLAAGFHEVPLDGRGDAGQPLASGIYLYRLETAEGAAGGRVVLLK